MAKFTFYQGESQTIEVIVNMKDGTPAELLGANVQAYLIKRGETITLPTIIEENTIKIKLDPHETILMSGVYDYEVTIVDAFKDIDLKVQDTFFVKPSHIKVTATPEP